MDPIPEPKEASNKKTKAGKTESEKADTAPDKGKRKKEAETRENPIADTGLLCWKDCADIRRSLQKKDEKRVING